MKLEKFYNEVKNLKGRGNSLIGYYITITVECEKPYEKTLLYDIMDSINKQGLDTYEEKELAHNEEIVYEINSSIYVTHDNIDYIKYKISKLTETLTKKLYNSSYINVKVYTDISKEYLDAFDIAEDGTNLDNALYTIKEEINLRVR